MDINNLKLDNIQVGLVKNLETVVALLDLNGLYIVAEGRTLSIYKKEFLDKSLDSIIPKNGDGSPRDIAPGGFLLDVLFENFPEDNIRYIKNNSYED